MLERVTEHRVPTALVLPRGHVCRAPGCRCWWTAYGGPGSQERLAEPRRWQHRQWWADQASRVVTIDNRGTPNVSTPRTPTPLYRGFSEVTLEDQVAALQALGARHRDLDLTRVGCARLVLRRLLRRPRRTAPPRTSSTRPPPEPRRPTSGTTTLRTPSATSVLPQEHPEVYERDSLIRTRPG
ncbi:hypothetical protein ACFSNO_28020 [Streptomyces cirratus]